jgi:AcrR family transcriptional regulator
MRQPSHKSSLAKAVTPHAPQRQRGRDRVAALVAAGAKVFGAKGYDAATMTEIAAVAGAAIGSLYQFFPTKGAIADAVHAAVGDALLAVLQRLAADATGLSPNELADKLYSTFFAFLTANPAFVTLADLPPDPGKTARRTAMRSSVADLLTAMNPPKPRHEAERLAILILHLMRVAVSVSGEPDLPDRDAVLADLRALMHRLIGTG